MNRAMRRHIALLLGSAIAGCALGASPGQTIFQTHCSVCHGNDGKGRMTGMPEFTRKHGVLSLPDTVLLQRIEHGYQAPGAPMAMPPRGGDPSLTDEQIERVLAYLRSRFGG
ncbi:MAG: c-type cytochrome [Steroidobacteraceae bacterium]